MSKSIFPPIFAALFALGLTSCSTITSLWSNEPEPIVPLNKQQLEALAVRAKEPQLLNVAVYPSDTGPIFAGTWKLHEGDVAAINLPADGLGRNKFNRAPIVPIGRMGSDPINAMLDTSSPQSWSRFDMLNTFDIRLLKAPGLIGARPDHVFDTIGGIVGVAAPLKIDQLVIGNGLFYVRAAKGPLGPLTRGHDDAELVAILGVDMMRAFNHVQIDFGAQYIVFSSSTDYQPTEDKVLASVPMLLTNGVVGVTGTIDGAPTNFIIDTGGDYAVALPAGTGAKKVGQITIEDLVLRDLPGIPGMDLALGPIITPRIGRQALSRFKITLDFRRQRVHFERP